MKFLILPHKEYTPYLLEKAKQFARGKVEIVVFRSEDDALDPDLTSIFVIKGYRHEADLLNNLRISKGLNEVFIVEVPRPIVKKRVIKNKIRARIAEILRSGPKHGYEIYKKYREIYGKISMRLIYYHLARGIKEGIFEIAKVEENEGDFSWGSKSRRKYYKLSE